MAWCALLLAVSCGAAGVYLLDLRMIFAGMLLIAAVLGMLFWLVCWCAKRPRAVKQSDCILLLGAKVYPDGRMSAALENRCAAALDAWQQGIAQNIIASGSFSEAAAMRTWLLARNVPGDRVLTEKRSASTWDNMKNSAALMQERGFRCAAVVTSDYHVQRALWLAARAKIDACGVVAPSSSVPKVRLKNRLREMRSWLLYAIRR